MAVNWVMLTRDGHIVPKANEKILYTSRQGVALDLSTPRELNIAQPFSLQSTSGLAFITNERVIYLPTRRTEQFQSFFAPVLNFSDTVVQSPWIGPWSWTGVVQPVPGGGVPPHIPRIEAKLTFYNGGQYDFQSTFETLKERLHHARELGLVPSQNIEPPPAYDPSGMPGPSSSAATATVESYQEQPPSQPQPVPDEPPPDYSEAQAQAVAMQLEERMREEAERR